MRPMIALCATCIAMLLLGGTASAASAYDEVPKEHWAYAALDYLCKAGALEGYPDGFFDPASKAFASGTCYLTRYEFAQAVARLADTVEQQQQGKDDDQIRCLTRGLLSEFADQITDIQKYPPFLRPPSRIFYHFSGAYDKVPLDHWAYGVLADFQQRGLLTCVVLGYYDGQQQRVAYDFEQGTALLLEQVNATLQVDPLDACMAEGLRAEFTIQFSPVLTQEQMDELAGAEAPISHPTQDPPSAQEAPETTTARKLASAVVDDGSLRCRLSIGYDAASRRYEMVLTLTNLGDQTVTFDYPTNERYDFWVLNGGERLWHYNINHFFVQQLFSEQLEPGQSQVYAGSWDGQDGAGRPIAAHKFSLQANLLWTAHPLWLQLNDVPNMLGGWTSGREPVAPAVQPQPTFAPSRSAYDDVPKEHWAYGALNALSEQGMLEGYPAGFFNGERTLTRYEFAQATARLLDTVDQEETAADPITLALAEALQAEFADQIAELSNKESYYGVPAPEGSALDDLK